jgi:hypothetical protein
MYASTSGRPTAFLGAVVTIGALLVAGKLAKDGIDDSIGKVGDESRALLQQARAEIERIITLIEKKYQDNLNLTLDSLDQFADSQFTRAYALVVQINEELQRTVGVIQRAAIEVIDRAAAQLRAAVDMIEKRIEQIVFVAAESGVWVVDNVWETIISVIALLFLAGLLLLGYGQAGSIIQEERLPSRIRLAVLGGLSVALLVAGLLLLLWKPLRGFIMTRTVSALHQRLEVNLVPQIFEVFPNTVTQGQTAEVKIIGANLPAKPPKVTVGNVELPVKLAEAGFVVVNLSSAATSQAGAQPLALRYDGLDQPLTSLIEFVGQGPDLVIDELTVNPASPTASEPFAIHLRVKNQGGPVQSYSLDVNLGTTDVQPISLSEATTLGQGQTKAFTLSSTYPKPGRFNVFARILGASPNEPSGPNGDNNRTPLTIDVQPRQMTPGPIVTPRPPIEDELPLECRKKPYLPNCQIP